MRMLSTLLLFALATPATAFTGNEYKATMNEDLVNPLRVGNLNYLMGAMSMYALGGLRGICSNTPDGVTVGQKVSIFEKFLEDNPQIAHYEVEVLMVTSLTEAFGTVAVADSGYCP